MTTILLVEDNEPSRDALGRRLARRGYDVRPAVDGQEAVAIARLIAPDLILMDLGLPVKDGWAATRELKQDEATRPIPIIIIPPPCIIMSPCSMLLVLPLLTRYSAVGR